MNVVIPMAGSGTRFAQAGYAKPKPFIDAVSYTHLDVYKRQVVALVDFFISLVILGIMMLCYCFMPGWRFLTLPLFLSLALLFAYGASLWFCSLNVKYRDFRHIVPFVVQLGLYISPVGFSSAIIPEKWRLLYSINPMVGVIDGFRWAILGGDLQFYWPGLIVSIGLTVLLFFSGLWYFRMTERTFADFI